jgi:hypothetical protein
VLERVTAIATSVDGGSVVSCGFMKGRCNEHRNEILN